MDVHRWRQKGIKSLSEKRCCGQIVFRKHPREHVVEGGACNVPARCAGQGKEAPLCCTITMRLHFHLPLRDTDTHFVNRPSLWYRPRQSCTCSTTQYCLALWVVKSYTGSHSANTAFLTFANPKPCTPQQPLKVSSLRF